MFPNFQCSSIDTGEATIRVRHGGSGPPLLLIHGHPRTHVTWDRVATRLARHYTIVCPDLRGYGESSKPPTTPDHEPYSKRAMARDCVSVMQQLGHDRFAVAGHDRGGYVAQRLALDVPDQVTRLALMDVVPIGEALARCGATFAQRWWHWFFLAQPADKPERAILADPEAWYAIDREHMSDEAWEDIRRAIHDPATVHAMCEDYRAGLGIDRHNDEVDKQAGRKIACPLLVLWATKDDLPVIYGDVLEVWRDWVDDLRGFGIDCGHHFAEEAPKQTAEALHAFLADPGFPANPRSSGSRVRPQ